MLNYITFIHKKNSSNENKILNFSKEYTYFFTWPCIYTSTDTMSSQIHSSIFCTQVFYSRCGTEQEITQNGAPAHHRAHAPFSSTNSPFWTVGGNWRNPEETPDQHTWSHEPEVQCNSINNCATTPPLNYTSEMLVDTRTCILTQPNIWFSHNIRLSSLSMPFSPSCVFCIIFLIDWYHMLLLCRYYWNVNKICSSSVFFFTSDFI